MDTYALQSPDALLHSLRNPQLEKRLRLGKISKSEFKAEMTRLHRDLGIDDDDGIVASAAAEAEPDPSLAGSRASA